MAKQKTFHSILVAKVKRDSRYCWNIRTVDGMRALFERYRPREPLPEEDRSLLGEGFPYLQQESFVRTFYEDFLLREATIEELDKVPLVYPGLMVGWETMPITMELDGTAAGFLRQTDLDFLDTPIEALRRPFPGCLLVDTRCLGFSLYGVSVDGVFVYPSYDLDCRYAMLHMLGVSLKKGLHFPLEAKLVLRGETLGEAIEFSKEEHERLRKLVLSGFDDGMHGEVFSPLSDEIPLMELVGRALAFSFGEHACVEERALSGGGRHLRVALRSSDDIPRSEEGVEVTDATPAIESAEAAKAEVSVADADSEGPAAVGALRDAVPATPVAPTFENGDVGEGEPLDHDALLAIVEELMQENDALKEALGAAESRSASLGYHLRQAQGSVDKLKAEVEALRSRAGLVEAMSVPETPLEALELAERAFPDRLVVMEEARRSARDFVRGSASETWAALQAVAVTLHRLVFGRSSGSLTHAFQSETGFEVALRDVKHTNRNPEYAKERRVLYAGEQRDATAHVKGKGVKKGECLRVHFFADYSSGRIVIAHCGEHLTTAETSRL